MKNLACPKKTAHVLFVYLKSIFKFSYILPVKVTITMPKIVWIWYAELTPV